MINVNVIKNVLVFNFDLNNYSEYYFFFIIFILMIFVLKVFGVIFMLMNLFIFDINFLFFGLILNCFIFGIVIRMNDLVFVMFKCILIF